MINKIRTYSDADRKTVFDLSTKLNLIRAQDDRDLRRALELK